MIHIAAGDPLWIALWVAAGLVSLFICLPTILGLLFGTRIVVAIEEGMPTFEAEGEPQHTIILRQLQSLGFTPLGNYSTALWFVGYFWVMRIQQRLFVCADQACYASVYELIPGDGLRVTLSTLFDDDLLVETENTEHSIRVERTQYSRIGFSTADMREFLSVHAERVARCRGETSRKPLLLDLRGFLFRDHPASGQDRKQERKLAARCLLVTLSALLAAAAMGMWLFSLDHMATPLNVLIMGLLKPWWSGRILRTGVREGRRRDAAERPDSPPRTEEWRGPGESGSDGDGSITTSSVPPR
jgi:hypothetical protein